MKLKRILKRILKWTSFAIVLALFVGIILVFIAYWRSTNDCGRTAAPKNPMKAIVYCDYGLPNLKLEEVEKPVPDDDQILVKVRAASVNPYDWHFVEGTPKIMRAMGVGDRHGRDCISLQSILSVRLNMIEQNNGQALSTTRDNRPRRRAFVA